MKAASSDFILTVVIPAYNSEAYLARAVNSVLACGHSDIETVIVDDGSRDGTAAMADEFEASHPGVVVAVHQENKGHGGAVNTGIRKARGHYLKVLDSDDWFDGQALESLAATLREARRGDEIIDLVITNYVYEKEGARRKKVMQYRGILPRNKTVHWDRVGRFSLGRYLMMHSLAYRTQVLRDSGLTLPEHTFYVDHLFVSVPLPFVQTIRYLDVNLYRYYIGRSDQSVNEKVMIRRIDQQLKVNRLLIDQLATVQTKSKKQYGCLVHHTEIVTVISSVLFIVSGGRENLKRKEELWEYIRSRSPALYHKLRLSIPGVAVNLSGSLGRKVTRSVYGVAQRIYGFN